MDPASAATLQNLTDDVTIVFIVIFGVTGPAWLLGQYMKYKSARKMGPDEMAALEQMARVAQRMEQRVGTLEQILDTEAPAWRNDSFEHGGQHGRQAG